VAAEAKKKYKKLQKKITRKKIYFEEWADILAILLHYNLL